MKMGEGPRNVLGGALESCCTSPMTGFYRTGRCETGPQDVGLHVVCARVTAEFLAFSKAQGNDLSTPAPEFGFPGLRPGDKWCLCAGRWKQALDAGVAHPPWYSARRTRRRWRSFRWRILCAMRSTSIDSLTPLCVMRVTQRIRYARRVGDPLRQVRGQHASTWLPGGARAACGA